jgi:hypothetical protein
VDQAVSPTTPEREDENKGGLLRNTSGNCLDTHRHVCVSPGVRTQARDDNAHAAERVNHVNHEFGPDTCVTGYVWREATPTDHVCVTPGARTQAADDNAHGRERLYGH